MDSSPVVLAFDCIPYTRFVYFIIGIGFIIALIAFKRVEYFYIVSSETIYGLSLYT